MVISPLRIVSLVPSLTELVVTLGLRPALVGRTGFCIHPREAVADVPKVGGTKDVNLARVRALRPTHVLVNVDENEAALAHALRDFVPHVVVTHPCGPHDNLALVDQLGDVFGDQPGVRERALILRQALSQRLARLDAARQRRGRLLYVIWRDPWMTVARDTYLGRMLALGGWDTWPAVDGGPAGAARYPVFTWDDAAAAGVAAVWLSSEPYRFGPQHLTEVRAACPQAAVRLVDGERLSWYGSRAVAGLDYLAAMGQPGA